MLKKILMATLGFVMFIALASCGGTSSSASSRPSSTSSSQVNSSSSSASASSSSSSSSTSEKTVVSVTVTAPTKTTYFIGDEVDTTGLKVTLNYSDNSSKEIDNTSYSVKVENNKLVITYLTFTKSIDLSFVQGYLVSYANGGGSGTNPTTSVKLAAGATIVLPENPYTKVGYTFAGYNDGKATYQPGATYTIPSIGNITMTAQWTNNKYTLSFDKAGGTGEATNVTTTYDVAIGTLPTLTKTGHVFAGWKIGTEVVSAATVWNYTENKTAVAQWTTESHTLSFDKAGGTGEATNITTTYGNAIGTLPTLTKVGHEFAGWKIGTEVVTAATVWNYTENKTAVAQWTVKEYTLSFDKAGGTGEATDITTTYGTVIGTLPTLTKVTEEGTYLFMGWKIGEEKIAENDIYNYTEDKTAVAQWLLNSFVLSFDAKGGTGTTPDIAVSFGTSIGGLPVVTKEGYTFVCWRIGELDIPATNNRWEYFESKTAIAIWEIKTLTISFDSDGGSEVTSITDEYNKTITKPDDPSKEGYEFAGWYVGEDFYSFPQVMPAANIALTAKWIGKDYTLSFNANEGIGAASDKEVTMGQAIGTLPVLTRVGYSFTAWKIDGVEITSSTIYNFAMDKEADAIWEAIPQVVTGIVIDTLPNKVEYLADETFDATGMVVKTVMNWGEGEVIESNEIIIGNTNALTTSDTTIRISYGEFYKDIDISVLPNLAVTAIEITTQPSKVTYFDGQSFDKTGMVVTATYEDHSKAVVLAYSISNIGALYTYDTEIIITYKSCEATVNITVKPVELDHLEIMNQPTKVKYYVGDYFNQNGLVVDAVNNDGSHDKNVTIDYIDKPLEVTDTFVTLNYIDKQINVPIQVIAITEVGIEIANNPYKTEYLAGDEFESMGLAVNIIYNNGSKEPLDKIEIPKETIKEDQTYVRITYKDFYADIAISVTNPDLNYIQIMDKTISNYQTSFSLTEDFNSTGLAILAYYENGSNKIIDSGFIVDSSDFEKGVSGDYHITVSYTENNITKDVNYRVTVVPPPMLSGIQIVSTDHKVDYKNGEDLDTSKLVVKTLYGHGGEDSETVITDYEINLTAYNAAKNHNDDMEKEVTIFISKTINGTKYSTSYKVRIGVKPKTFAAIDVEASIEANYKTSFAYNEDYSFAGLKLSYQTGDDEPVIVDVTSAMVDSSNYVKNHTDYQSEKYYTIYITTPYGELSYQVSVAVKPAPAVIGIEFDTDCYVKRVFENGSEYQSGNLIVNKIYADNYPSAPIDNIEDVVIDSSDFTSKMSHDEASAVTATINLSYTPEGGSALTTSYTVSIKPKVVVNSISINSSHVKTNYNWGEELDLSAIVISYTKNDGSIGSVRGSDENVSIDTLGVYDANHEESETKTFDITVSYQGKTDIVEVTVSSAPSRYVESISIVDASVLTEEYTFFEYGGDFAFPSNLKIKVKYNYGDDEVIDVTESMIDYNYIDFGHNNYTATETYKVYISYDYMKTSYDVTVKSKPNPIVGIKVTNIDPIVPFNTAFATYHSTQELYGICENDDVISLSLVYRAVTNSGDFDQFSVPGTYDVTYTYQPEPGVLDTDITYTYTICVLPEDVGISKIEISGDLFNPAYAGEEIDLSGLTAKLLYGGDDQYFEIDLPNEAIKVTGIPSEPGTAEVTFSYSTHTAEKSINFLSNDVTSVYARVIRDGFYKNEAIDVADVDVYATTLDGKEIYIEPYAYYECRESYGDYTMGDQITPEQYQLLSNDLKAYFVGMDALYTIVGFDSSVAGNISFTVKYMEVSSPDVYTRIAETDINNKSNAYPYALAISLYGEPEDNRVYLNMNTNTVTLNLWEGQSFYLIDSNALSDPECKVEIIGGYWNGLDKYIDILPLHGEVEYYNSGTLEYTVILTTLDGEQAYYFIRIESRVAKIAGLNLSSYRIDYYQSDLLSPDDVIVKAIYEDGKQRILRTDEYYLESKDYVQVMKNSFNDKATYPVEVFIKGYAFEENYNYEIFIYPYENTTTIDNIVMGNNEATLGTYDFFVVYDVEVSEEQTSSSVYVSPTNPDAQVYYYEGKWEGDTTTVWNEYDGYYTFNKDTLPVYHTLKVIAPNGNCDYFYIRFIERVPKVTSIKIDTEQSKVTYYQNEDPTASDFVVEKVYDDKSTSILDISEYYINASEYNVEIVLLEDSTLTDEIWIQRYYYPCSTKINGITFEYKNVKVDTTDTYPTYILPMEAQGERQYYIEFECPDVTYSIYDGKYDGSDVTFEDSDNTYNSIMIYEDDIDSYKTIKVTDPHNKVAYYYLSIVEKQPEISGIEISNDSEQRETFFHGEAFSYDNLIVEARLDDNTKRILTPSEYVVMTPVDENDNPYNSNAANGWSVRVVLVADSSITASYYIRTLSYSKDVLTSVKINDVSILDKLDISTSYVSSYYELLPTDNDTYTLNVEVKEGYELVSYSGKAIAMPVTGKIIMSSQAWASFGVRKIGDESKLFSVSITIIKPILVEEVLVNDKALEFDGSGYDVSINDGKPIKISIEPKTGYTVKLFDKFDREITDLNNVKLSIHNGSEELNIVIYEGNIIVREYDLNVYFSVDYEDFSSFNIMVDTRTLSSDRPSISAGTYPITIETVDSTDTITIEGLDWTNGGNITFTAGITEYRAIITKANNGGVFYYDFKVYSDVSVNSVFGEYLDSSSIEVKGFDETNMTSNILYLDVPVGSTADDFTKEDLKYELYEYYASKYYADVTYDNMVYIMKIKDISSNAVVGYGKVVLVCTAKLDSSVEALFYNMDFEDAMESEGNLPDSAMIVFANGDNANEYRADIDLVNGSVIYGGSNATLVSMDTEGVELLNREGIFEIWGEVGEQYVVTIVFRSNDGSVTKTYIIAGEILAGESKAMSTTYSLITPSGVELKSETIATKENDIYVMPNYDILPDLDSFVLRLNDIYATVAIQNKVNCDVEVKNQDNYKYTLKVTNPGTTTVEYSFDVVITTKNGKADTYHFSGRIIETVSNVILGYASSMNAAYDSYKYWDTYTYNEETGTYDVEFDFTNRIVVNFIILDSILNPQEPEFSNNVAMDRDYERRTLEARVYVKSAGEYYSIIPFYDYINSKEVNYRIYGEASIDPQVSDPEPQTE